MAVKKVASKKDEVSELPIQHEIIQPENQAVDVKALHIYFDTNQIPQLAFSGRNWCGRDILHIRRVLVRDYKRHLKTIRNELNKEAKQ